MSRLLPLVLPSRPRRRVSRGASFFLVSLAATAAAVPAQRQFEELRKRGLPSDFDHTAAVGRGDVDADGDRDLVFGNVGQNRLYLNDGTGVYTDATATRMPALGDGTRAVALGDVDGDGDLDVVFGNGGYFFPQQNRLYVNDGTGSYTDETAARLPAVTDRTSAVVLADFDADGDLDLAFGNGQGGPEQDSLYLNDGSGTYTDASAARLPANRYATTALAVGDVDGDGDLDMIAAHLGRGYLSGDKLYLNDGAGTFTDATRTRMPFDFSSTRAIALGDVDGDGDLDLLSGNEEQRNELFLNDGTGTYTDATSGRLPAGLDDTRAVALGDIDADGDLDIVVGNDGQPNRLFLNGGSGTFTELLSSSVSADSGPTYAVALADVDGDGGLDIVFACYWEQQNRLYLHLDDAGAVTWAEATAARVPAESHDTSEVALGDVDGDGDVDIVFGNSTGRNRLYLNDGGATFRDATVGQLPDTAPSTTSLALSDVDGDSDPDLLVGTLTRTRLYLNNGLGSYTDATAARMPAGGAVALGLGDVDSDGDVDLVLARGSANRLYLNDGTGRFTDGTSGRMPVDNDSSRGVALGDVDADGDLDILFANDPSRNRLYLNDGTGRYADVSPARMPLDSDSSRRLVLGDIDADGDLDVVIANFGAQNRVYLNDGTGTYVDATAARIPVDGDRTTSVALGDIDVDGDVDILFGNRWEQNRLHVNDGAGFYTDESARRMPALRDATWGAASGDLDRDGDPDVVFANRYEQNRLYINLVRQLDAPFLLRAGERFALDAYARLGPPSLVDVAVPFVSTGSAAVPLPPFGTFGVDPTRMVVLPAFVIPQPVGVGSTGFYVPNAPGLAGISLYAQALLVSYPVSERLTNVTGDVLVR